MSFKRNLSMYFNGFVRIKNNMSIVKKGQENRYAIFQTSHRLEKGLCIRDPRKLWGFDKADSLVELLFAEISSKKPDKQAIKIGASVLAAFIKAKSSTNDKEEMANADRIKEKATQKGILKFADSISGGAINYKRVDILPEIIEAEKLFLTRHSVRDFADTSVDMKKLEKAINLALRSPSACNRQASQIYVIDGEDIIKAGGKNEYHADKYLIITGNMRAFSVPELNDWIVSTSIFCGYLSLALHAEGIASCFFRKDIVCESKYNSAIRKLCKIPADEQIILEMAIGNYKDEITVPVSCRKQASDILHVVK